MTTYNFKQQNPNIIAIGSVGGASKASTGYTFLRIQNEAKILAAQLLAGKVPVQVFGTNRFTVYDNALLNILKSKGHEGERVFADLFKYNPPERLLKFLDEDTSLGEEVQLMLTVPQTLFIKSLLQFYLG